jgi:hypothetical protein
MATRLDKIRSLSAEQLGRIIIDKNLLDDKDPKSHFCKGNCAWAESVGFHDDGPDENECLQCCVRWLNEEADL